jgi:hypothetical protein
MARARPRTMAEAMLFSRTREKVAVEGEKEKKKEVYIV